MDASAAVPLGTQIVTASHVIRDCHARHDSRDPWLPCDACDLRCASSIFSLFRSVRRAGAASDVSRAATGLIA